MSDLGAALRAWRDRTDPATVGLTNASPRRVVGLRRSELATLAGISPEYVARLEQGRAATPSVQVCASLARALRLSDDEEAHLMHLAGFAAAPDRIPWVIPSSLHRVIDHLGDTPVAVYNAAWRLLHWNRLFAAVFGDPVGATADDLNALIVQFESRNPRVRQTEIERAYFEQSLVADLRATSARYPNDPEVAALISRMAGNDRFCRLWALRAVANHESAHKTAVHPEVGAIPLDANVLTTQNTDLRVVVLTPRADTTAREKLNRLG
ncbi:helix-turn-helix transcriptional regulator [Micromonospora sp. WMMD1102]|uniref:helix-turn-helix transcriptional regulator n=1 Tax=Micromonospora sp. WMMD1102 TaxID=3016105 RepID=UPI0024156377|nr:helix-turn-helix transcriptional regulator [Micromonospora sp. WMMD1102]MDG4787731.1 helix-turn-helix transcriptional regulator [Micromonospora sp. WMMD1102]